MSGFEIPSTVLTLCHTPSFQYVTPFCTTHLNQFYTEDGECGGRGGEGNIRTGGWDPKICVPQMA